MWQPSATFDDCFGTLRKENTMNIGSVVNSEPGPYLKKYCVNVRLGNWTSHLGRCEDGNGFLGEMAFRNTCCIIWGWNIRVKLTFSVCNSLL